MVHAGQQAVFLREAAEGGVVALEQVLAAVDFFERDAVERQAANLDGLARLRRGADFQRAVFDAEVAGGVVAEAGDGDEGGHVRRRALFLGDDRRRSTGKRSDGIGLLPVFM